MKRTKKILVALLCAVLLVTGTVAVTVAYLTASTTVVENTFTVGKVAIELDETDVNVYGEKDGDTRVKENSYKLIPNHTYQKDPEVRVLKESEVCWVFIKVTNGISAIEDSTNTIAKQIEANNWVALDGATNVYYYKTTVDARTAEQKLPVFANFKVDSNANVSEFSTASIKIDAYAVQADGFDTAAAAWAAAPGEWEN